MDGMWLPCKPTQRDRQPLSFHTTATRTLRHVLSVFVLRKQALSLRVHTHIFTLNEPVEKRNGARVFGM